MVVDVLQGVVVSDSSPCVVGPEALNGVLDIGDGIVAALIEAVISASATASLVFMVSVVRAPFARRRGIQKFAEAVGDAASAKDLR